MTDPDSQRRRLFHLHECLIMDTRTAITGALGQPSRAGLAWLKDHEAYRRLWRAIVRSKHDPELMLNQRFGFCTTHAEPDTE